jgi:ankyrin repeat protein
MSEGVGVVRLLLADPRFDANLEDPEIGSPLSVACCFSQGPVTELLLSDPRVDINQRSQGETPLMLACTHAPSSASALLLLRQGRWLDLLSRDESGRDARALAEENGHLDVIREINRIAKCKPPRPLPPSPLPPFPPTIPSQIKFRNRNPFLP